MVGLFYFILFVLFYSRVIHIHMGTGRFMLQSHFIQVHHSPRTYVRTYRVCGCTWGLRARAASRSRRMFNAAVRSRSQSSSSSRPPLVRTQMMSHTNDITFIISPLLVWIRKLPRTRTARWSLSVGWVSSAHVSDMFWSIQVDAFVVFMIALFNKNFITQLTLFNSVGSYVNNC